MSTKLLLTCLLCLGLPFAAQDGGKTPVPERGLSGAVSEEEFKAMHLLKDGEAPKLLGSEIELAGGKAYLSLPKDAKGPLPALVVIHEWWGLNDNVKHWTDRFAAEGYAAIAVDLYAGTVAKTSDDAMKAMRAVDAKKGEEIIAKAMEFLRKDERIRAKRIGSIGWCFGGGWSLKTALAAKDLDAAVIYYGHLVQDVEALKGIKARVMGIFGSKDRSIPPADVEAFDKALTAAGVTHEIHSYEANHAFANPSNPVYDQVSAAAAWKEVRRFLADALKKD